MKGPTYLVQMRDEEPFTTNHFDPNNHWVERQEMIVYNLKKEEYMIDGVNWLPIQENHL